MDSMGAAFRSVGRDCGGASDADERNVRFRQFDGAAVCLPRHRLGSLYRYDLVRPFTEEVRERSFGIGNQHSPDTVREAPGTVSRRLIDCAPPPVTTTTACAGLAWIRRMRS